MNSRRAPSKRIWEAFAFGLSGIKTEPTPPSLPRVIFLRFFFQTLKDRTDIASYHSLSPQAMTHKIKPKIEEKKTTTKNVPVSRITLPPGYF